MCIRDRYIKRVEDELTFPLYERDRGRCIPTAAGTVLLEHGKALLENYESMLEEMKTAANVKDVRIGWPTGYTLLYFTKLFSYMENNFLVNAHILEDSVEVLLSALLKKDIDLLFTPAIYAHPSMEYVTVRHEEFYLGCLLYTSPLFCNDYRYVMLRLVHMGNYRYNAGDQAVFGKGLRSENADPSAASKVTAAS